MFGSLDDYPAVIERGQLRTSTTGGTSMQCVLEHVARTRPDAAIVVTDGFIEAISRSQVAKTRGTRRHVLVTRSGNVRLVDFDLHLWRVGADLVAADVHGRCAARCAGPQEA